MVIVGSVTVPSNSTVTAFYLPSGLSNCLVYQPTNPQPVYIGTSSRVSSANGMPVFVTPTELNSYHFCNGTAVFATTGNGTASSFQYLISTAS